MRVKTIFAIASCFFIITGLITSMAVAGALTPNPALTQDGEGLNLAAEGIGLEGLDDATAYISINIGGPVQAAYLYWAGRARPCPTDGTNCNIPFEPYADQELIFDDTLITGEIAGFESQLDTSLSPAGQDINNIGYLADVTAIVQAKGAGLQTFAIQDADPDINLFRLNGAGLIVLYQDLADPVSYRVMVYDGLDFAFGRNDQIPEAQTTTPVIFNHGATGNDRTAQIVLFNGDATLERPDRIDVTDAFGATTQFANQLISADGESWDVFKTDIIIPANGGTSEIQLFSEPFGQNPDSLLWELGALRVPLGVPEIELLKQVSLTGGEPFFDADTPESAPVGEIGADATYRLIVRNVGTETLVNLRITDPTLGLLDVPVPGGPLAPGEERVITSGDTGFGGLFFEDRCDSAGAKLNIARVDAEGEDTGAPVSDDDPAVVGCNPPEEELGCRLTGGLNATFDTGNGVNRYTSGGQVGANTGAQPQPKGEWTHTQHDGPAGDFTFRGGTSSAPEGSEIDAIRCSDPDGCKPSGNPPSPVKQLDFDGIGTFKNIGNKDDKVPDFVDAGATVTAEGKGNKNFNGTFHWFEVNIDDLGEPGNTNPKKNPGDVDPDLCPSIGFGEKGEPGTENSANCECSDFYRITIYDGVNAEDIVKNPDGSIDPSQLNRTDVIYEVWGPIDGGNYQIHGPTGFDSKNQ